MIKVVFTCIEEGGILLKPGIAEHSTIFLEFFIARNFCVIERQGITLDCKNKMWFSANYQVKLLASKRNAL